MDEVRRYTQSEVDRLSDQWEFKEVTTLHDSEPMFIIVREVLWGGDKDCIHDVYSADGGGLKCRKCTAWFCY